MTDAGREIQIRFRQNEIMHQEPYWHRAAKIVAADPNMHAELRRAYSHAHADGGVIQECLFLAFRRIAEIEVDEHED